MSEGHHVIPQQRIKQAVSTCAVKQKLGKKLTLGEERLLSTPLPDVLGDQRNIVKLSREAHHRAHHFERLSEHQLPAGIRAFARQYGLEPALERELRLMRTGKP